MRHFLEALGARFIACIRYTGGLSVLMGETLFWIPIPPFRRKQIAEQMSRIGVDSLPIVSLISLFTGMVLALQSAYQMKRFSAEMYIASLVVISITRELGPVLTALIVAGRIGASITAELGTMKVTEEIDALRTLGFSPMGYLVLPRIAALAFVAPTLVLAGDIVACLGGAVAAGTSLDVNARAYLAELRTAVVMPDVLSGMVKGTAFALAIAMIGCGHGFATTGGAAGVGRRTTATVVTSLFAIVIVDTLLTLVFRTWWR